MEFLNKIKEAIFAGYEHSPKVITNKFILPETDKSAKCKEGKFQKSNEILVYKFDKTPKKDGKQIKDIMPFFNDSPSIKSMCDYILFYPVSNHKVFIILCNLKSGNRGNCNDQFDAGEYFSEFIIKTVKRFGKINDIEIKFKKVLFSSILLYKPTTNPKKIKDIKLHNYICGIDVCNLDNICH